MALTVSVAVTVTGCARADTLDEQAAAGSGKNYVAGDGTVTELQPADRGEPLSPTGESSSGEPVDVSALRGQVVVLNVWYAACGPCRQEARDLAALATEFADQQVHFVGVNSRDDAATVAAFERTFGVEYPSIVDQNGSAAAALTGQVPPNAVPTTLVLDREGRVAGRILGIAQPSILRAIIKTVTAEEN